MFWLLGQEDDRGGRSFLAIKLGIELRFAGYDVDDDDDDDDDGTLQPELDF